MQSTCLKMGASNSQLTYSQQQEKTKQENIKKFCFDEKKSEYSLVQDALQSDVDKCIADNCEIGIGLFVSEKDMQSALLAYMTSIDRYAICWRWFYARNETIFDHFEKELFTLNKVCKSRGMLVGIRIKTWPSNKQTW